MLQTVDQHETSLSPNRGAVQVHAHARAAQEQQYRQQLHQMQHLQRQLESYDDRLERLKHEPNEDRKALVEQRVAEYARDPRSIAPEDALDTIVRLENHLKLQQRANALMAKELDRDRRTIKERRGTLHKIETNYAEVLKVTGWDGKTLRSQDEQDEMKERINEMAMLAKKLREEHRAAQLIIHKKEHVVQFLHAELAKRNEQREQLDEKYNAIRVKDRDNREILLQIEKLQRVSEHTDNQVAVARQNQDTVALECLQEDNDYLKNLLKEKRQKRADQDRVMRAQASRVKQLTTRFEVIGGALRDLGLDRRAANALNAVPPPVEPIGEPDDMERIAPSDEQIPTCVYELLVRDMASIRSAVARKDVMVVEKQCVKAAMEEKLHTFEENLRYAQQQEAHTKDDKFLEMEHLRHTLEERHREYRLQIDDLLHENLKLKADAAKARQQHQQRRA
uniref:Uncharacterized protein n=1 Tax=Neobodo designis TaxID=312471 RepID=A0A7S1L2R2_NEODS|mmetsp:Transcript_13465/g.41886  ORF Transcript_13465/g.41886 Transcript_13465/m.41886 type:complete len:451 (+) Transcript_13465:164-1516(+)